MAVPENGEEEDEACLDEDTQDAEGEQSAELADHLFDDVAQDDLSEAVTVWAIRGWAFVRDGVAAVTEVGHNGTLVPGVRCSVWWGKGGYLVGLVAREVDGEQDVADSMSPLAAASALAAAAGSSGAAEEVVQAAMEVIGSTTVGMMMEEEELRKEAEIAIGRGMAPVPPRLRLRSEARALWREAFMNTKTVLEWAEAQQATAVGVDGTMSLVLLAEGDPGYVVEFVHWSNGPPTTLAPQVVQVVKVDSSQRVIYSVPAVRPQRLIDAYHIILPSTGTVHRKVLADRRQQLPDKVVQLHRLWISSAADLGAGVLCDWCCMPTAEGVQKCPLCTLSYHVSCARNACPYPDVPFVRLPAEFSFANVCQGCKHKCHVSDGASSGSVANRQAAL